MEVYINGSNGGAEGDDDSDDIKEDDNDDCLHLAACLRGHSHWAPFDLGRIRHENMR